MQTQAIKPSYQTYRNPDGETAFCKTEAEACYELSCKREDLEIYVYNPGGFDRWEPLEDEEGEE